MAGGRLGSRAEESVQIKLACMYHIFNQDLVTMCRLAVGMSSLVLSCLEPMPEIHQIEPPGIGFVN